ncbi:hypothetical protein M501DRAFT_1011269 [Patellaria atrata CBS 101060]|uniref:SPRY domain-containing protein n=1 Tax=Patellaria atrata CBS 101060 TaxID=1346257 RepID=A0A9P4SCR1_9PEZI|nr:hypothetical protein M501DRAFT_1011269 [Patellaria atrata CBS 101060]
MTGETFQPPSGPPPSWRARAQEEYPPPAGPPPGYGPHISFAPRPGRNSSSYDPLPGPPPSFNPQRGNNDETYAPPQGPPPSKKQSSSDAEPPPYHDWTVIPDTALLPPPPSMSYDESFAGNANRSDSDKADIWCERFPMYPPFNFSPAQLDAIRSGQIILVKPPEYTGDLLPTKIAGVWKCRTWAKCKDACLLTALPLYSALAQSPLRTGRPKTIYYELKIIGVGRQGGHTTFEEADASISIGFAAPPYPSWRAPGWQRASLGVHGDDGRRFVNDPWGGLDFTDAFNSGDTVGLGITYSLPKNPPAYGNQAPPRLLDAEVFFTRNGKKNGGWDLHEQLDEKIIGGVRGLEGDYDIVGAVGVFGGVDFEVIFQPGQWMYQPEHI